MQRIDIQIPFSGFYETWHDQKCNDAVESAFNYNHETDEDQEVPDAFYNAPIDWQAIFVEYAKHYADAFADEIGFHDIKFLELSSPREYNFTTDRIFINVLKSEMDAIKDKVLADVDGRAYVSARYTSRDGFSSFYSNDLTSDDWTKEPLDENQYGTILDFYVDMQHRDDPNNVHEWSMREYDIIEYMELYSWDSVINAQNAVDAQIEKEKQNA